MLAPDALAAQVRNVGPHFAPKAKRIIFLFMNATGTMISADIDAAELAAACSLILNLDESISLSWREGKGERPKRM